MKIKGKGECFYRTFKYVKATVKVINNDTDEIAVKDIILDGEYFEGMDVLNACRKNIAIANANFTVFKLVTWYAEEKKIAMTIDDFLRYGFEIDDDFKPVGE